jgi:hypothetical protein
MSYDDTEDLSYADEMEPRPTPRSYAPMWTEYEKEWEDLGDYDYSDIDEDGNVIEPNGTN